jgi:hypothetical protein
MNSLLCHNSPSMWALPLKINMWGQPPSAVRSSEARQRFARARDFALAVACLVTLTVPARAANPATITFSLDFPGSDPDHYSVSVRSDGHATYESKGKMSADSEDHDAYQLEFILTEQIRAQIFDLAARAHYFSGKIDSGNKKLAFTGAKTLTYSDAQGTVTANYNYSSQHDVEDLTTLFESISATLEFGRRLTYDHRYQKLALDEELKHMETQAAAHALLELQAVKPVLQAIYDDNSVINVVRARAQRVMEMDSAPSR